MGSTCCPQPNKTHRQIWIAGTLVYGPVMLLELSETDIWEGVATFTEEGEILVTIRHGKKQRRNAAGQLVVDAQLRPLGWWCKISTFRVWDDPETRTCKVEQKTYKTFEPIPDRDDWRKPWIYKWADAEETDGDDFCAGKLRRMENANMVAENYATKVDATQAFGTDANGNQIALFDGVLSLGTSPQFAGEAEMEVFDLERGEDSCSLSLTSRTLKADINGFNFSQAQVRKARVFTAAGWFDNE